MDDPSALIVVFCTAPDVQTAERLATGLTEQRLAACVKVIAEVRSFYRWEGRLETASEVQLLIKTRRGRFEELKSWIHEQHPYDVPELVAVLACDVSGEYAKWAVEQTE